MKRTFTTIVIVIATLFAMLTSVPPANARTVDSTNPGSWTTTANCPGVNPIHAAMLPSGKLLLMAGSGYNQQNFNMKINQAWLYNPDTPTVCPVETDMPDGIDLFCAGMTHLPDGRILVFGGTGKYGSSGSFIGSPNYYTGIKDTYVYDEPLNTFTKYADMAVGRWYGTGARRANGDVDVFGGLGVNAEWTQNHELFNADTKTWTQLPTPPWKMPMYAGTVLLPNGRYAYTGTYFGVSNGVNTMSWNPSNYASTPITGLPTPTCRNQANTLFMYPKIYVIGGACTSGVTSSVGMLDLTKGTTFTNAGYTGMAGTYQCAAVLPDKSLFLSHGSADNVTSLLAAKRLPENATTWQTLAPPKVMRGYHSTCMQLKDGRVVTMGSNWKNGTVETRFEVYNPWYTQPGFVRPTFLSLDEGTEQNSCGTTSLTPGATVKAKTGVATIASATLTSLPSVTHQHDANGRTVPLAVTQTSFGNVEFTAPGATNYFPAGHYMLSMVDWRGAPSISKIVHIGGTENGCCC